MIHSKDDFKDMDSILAHMTSVIKKQKEAEARGEKTNKVYFHFIREEEDIKPVFDRIESILKIEDAGERRKTGKTGKINRVF